MDVVRKIQARSREIQRDFLTRNRSLNQIRSDLYLSGTHIRDYVFDPDPNAARKHLADLSRTHRQIDQALAAYSQILNPSESAPFRGLQAALDSYWSVTAPVLTWTQQQRATAGFPFLRDEILPRRQAMLSIANQIAAINEDQLRAADLRTSGLFAAFQTRLIVAMVATLALGALLAVFSARRILSLERRTEQARAELKSLSARLVNLQESERRAISRELHDEVGQSLTAILYGMSSLSAAIPIDAPEEIHRHLAALRTTAEQSVGVVRNMALLLRPSMLDDLGLLAAVEWQARETSRQTGLLVSVSANGPLDRLSDESKTCVYRIVQEALHNTVRHAGATSVRIGLHGKSGRLSLTIQDDGRGFDIRQAHGLGLIGMEERVANLGGTLILQSKPGQGTLVAVDIPGEDV